jgi:flagellar basal-body rod protein FlgG
MNGSMRTSASGMAAQQRMIDVIANNLANVNTTAFKRSRVSFEDVLYETLEGSRVVNYQGSQTVAPVQVGKGVRVAAILRHDAQGSPEVTQRPLDLSIEGEGYLQVQRPDGTTAYTRDGALTISDQGQLTTKDGYLVLPGIQVPADSSSVSISANGMVSVQQASSTSAVEIGRLELARFLNSSGLLATGQNLLQATPASGEAILGYAQEDGFGLLNQGSLESSNVEIVTEMTEMIAAQRAYEINAKAIRTAEDMMSATNDIIR